MSERGTLKVYLGVAPGVGKTYRMLDEGNRRAARGTDVVVGLVETHGRAHTAEMIGELATVPRLKRAYRGAEFTEMDVDAVLARAPQVVLVDELAHTNVPGGRNAKRWQDVEELLAAGIDVVTTVNIQHLESLNDVVEKITGVAQRETVPDAVVRAAEQIELVDMPPEALRRRMAHGNIYPAEKIDAALSNYFRPGNLTALRELGLLWTAERVDEYLQRYRVEHGIAGVWEARERVVVALTGGPEGSTLIRRAARIAARARSSGEQATDLLAVHVARSDGLVGADPGALAEQRALIESLGGTFHSVVGDDIPAALLEFARAENATQLVLGTSRRGRLSRAFSPGIGETVVNDSGDIDVHMVTHERAAKRRLRWPARLRPARRELIGMSAAACVPPLVTLALAQLRTDFNLPSQVLIFLCSVVAVARLGGILSALVAAVSASLFLNYFFIPPFYTFTIGEPNNIIAFVVFVVVAVTLASVVDAATRLARRAAHAGAEAETLSVLAGSVLRGDDALPALVERARETFGMAGAAILATSAGIVDGDSWRTIAAAGLQPIEHPAQADIEVPVGADAVLALRGRQLPAADRKVLAAFAGYAEVVLERDRLAREAAAAKPLVEADKMRTALLAAVSHDLRAPLAAAKVSVSSLLDPDVEYSPSDRTELLHTANASLDRLNRLVENLLDMSRLQAGALRTNVMPVGLEEVVPLAVDDLALPPGTVQVADLETVPDAMADPVLLERVVANLVGNAARFSPPGNPVLITGSALADHVELRVIDRGPGIPAENREQVFTPFQRLGDRDNATGVGLGLALSRGLTEAMGGTLTPEDTPGGGLTMVVRLPAADTAEPPAARTPEVLP